jgi:hypothetical protein
VTGLPTTARSRANTTYVSCNFVGTARGSLAAMILWRTGGWIVVAAAGFALCLLALAARVTREQRCRQAATRR